MIHYVLCYCIDAYSISIYIVLKSRLLDVIDLQLELKMSKQSPWDNVGHVFFFWHTGIHGLQKMRCKNATRILAFLNLDIDFAFQT